MSDSGSILQLQSKAKAFSKVNLLIVTNEADRLKAIANSLCAAEIDFTYDFINHQQLSENTNQCNYSAILYSHVEISEVTTTVNTTTDLVKQIRWCRHIYPDTPLILITDTLGDEQAVKLIQSGVSGYVLRHKLDRLPDILEQSLFYFVSEQTIVRQQQALIEQKQDLIEKQQDLIQHLETQQQTWQEQEQQRQEHISYLAHELRTPIASISGFAYALKEQYYGELNDKQMQYATLIFDSAEHLLDLVENYLEITKLDADRQSLELERIAVVEICSSSILMMEEKAQEKGLELNFKLEKGIDFCIADSSRLRQILLNLIGNAIKFTDRGSITLKVKKKNDRFYFAVEDTGTGISAKNMKKLFKAFPQISNHRENTGLGLTLSQKIAQLHGGEITVTSELGKGSCFTLVIPQQPLVIDEGL